MPRFYASHELLKKTTTIRMIIEAIEAKNKPTWHVWNNFKRGVLIVEAKNCPEDRMDLGIIWQEELFNAV